MVFPWLSFLTLVFSSSFSPGPNNIMCMTLGQEKGVKITFKYILGAVTGHFMLVSILALFNQYIYANFPKVIIFFKIVGIAYLFYLAMVILYSSFSNNEQSKKSSMIEDHKLFITAMLFQFVNPKAVLFGMSIFSAYIIPHYQDRYVLLMFALLLSSVTFFSLTFWTSFGALLHNFIKNNKKIFNSIMAFLLLYSAYTII